MNSTIILGLVLVLAVVLVVLLGLTIGTPSNDKKHKPYLISTIVTFVVILGMIVALINKDEYESNAKDISEVTQKQEDSTSDSPKDETETKTETIPLEKENTTDTGTTSSTTSSAPSQESQNALRKAEFYANEMYMSKKDIYQLLTSAYGEKFPADAAQYAVDNLHVDYKENAVKKANSYFEDMNMSKAQIYDLLVSDYGEGFTPEEAQYGINHLKE